MVGNTWEGDNDAREREVVNFAAAACDSIWWCMPGYSPRLQTKRRNGCCKSLDRVLCCRCD